MPTVPVAGEKILIGISSCLLGEKTRFDGSHKHDRYITQTLGELFEFMMVCPEVEVGLGTPRPTLRLEGQAPEVSLIQPKTGFDLSDKMRAYAERRVRGIKSGLIFGFILKSKSPSCGMERVKVYEGQGQRPKANGVGFFAKALMERFPNLPFEEEGRLTDPYLRENWINRVVAYHRFYSFMYPRPSVGKLVRYHTQIKFTVLSHCQKTYRQLGPIVANAKARPMADVLDEYEALLMAALRKRATPAKHVNVLEHLMGFFKKDLDPEVRSAMLKTIQDYRAGRLPLIVPISLIRHYAELLHVTYVKEQFYLSQTHSFI